MSHLKQVVVAFRSTIPSKTSTFTSKLCSLSRASLAAGVFLFGLSVSGAQAAIVVYSGDASQAAWEAATSSPSVLVDFNSAPPPGFALTTGSDLPGTFIFDLSSGSLEGKYRDRANDAQTTKPLISSLGAGVMAIGADWDLAFDGAGAGIRLLVTFVDSTLEFVATEIPNTFAGEFFGIVSDVAIRSIQFDAGTQGGAIETFELDNARFVAAVPIPAALPLFLSAIAALGFVARRKKRLAAA